MGTFNGIGTTLYGQADKRGDGSYVTTEWFVIIYFPIIPIRSLRIRPISSKGFTIIVASSREFRYQILGHVPLSKNLRQVLLTWLWTIIPLAYLLFGKAFK